ncbi:rhodanese-like domain-containing protein [Desertibacillus haloalkaliphilus]|uniref:rhodanese-like domain-containing protein n=1 Tax=Desertibacillus haloalkaliphilus TaxID=1328930 RepID=UPI001C2571EB|nr:rhodanese-like domain-containing protein [Desertibacillus haloalkaliphilus]MBU8908705.1 rhodanese-like domain-containing protein [Desertibacillus haloalkaliphilus]
MKEITPEKVVTLPQSSIIDVREPDEVAAGKIPGSINIPLGLLEFRLHELDKTKEYILVCRSGSRSAMATKFLESRGYHATNMVGGMIEWRGQID